MADSDIQFFSLLKKEIGAKLKSTISSVPIDIENWKGQDIVYFQEDLERIVNSRISEKWFYTHIKPENKKLPRIDMLNLLSKYAGYSDWIDFKNKKHNELPLIVKKRNSKNRYFLFILMGCIIIIFLFTAYRQKTYSFCFIDSDTRNQITDQQIEIILLNEKESPQHFRCNDGCFTIKTRRKQIQFVVKTPYYKQDTITRIINTSRGNEGVLLQTNDYALMIHLFSRSKVSDWQKRRTQLDNMFTENAQIFQVSDDKNIGMELYNKNEFINKLTMPLKSLNNIEVIETIYTGNKISALRFRQIQNIKE